jgi:hypothetical protein
MPSKFEQLRSGQAVEIEPGVSGRLDQNKKTLQLSTGEVLNVANDPDFFPRDQTSLNVSRQKESIQKGIKGPVGEFFYQYGSQGIPGGASDWVSYLTQTGEEYANRKRAEQEVSGQISKESPYISAAATGANIATDLALTRGMSATRAAPLLTLGSAGSRLVTEPENVATEAAIGAVGGNLLDRAGNYLNKVAQRRAQVRAIPGQQEAVRNQNILGEQNVRNSNIAQQNQFNLSKQNVKNVNEARLQQHQADLNARQNQMIQAQNSFEQAKAVREAEVIRLKNQYEVAKSQRSAEASRLEGEYKAAKASAEQETKRLQDEFKLAQAQYQESLKQLPELQRKAQAEFSSNVVKNAEQIERSFPKSSKISTDELGVANFIDESVKKTGLAGSTEANKANRILKSLFPEGELLGGRELSKRYKALEDAIQRSAPEVQEVLVNFKNHLGQRLPQIVEDSIAHAKIMPLLKRTLEGDIKTILGDLSLGKEFGPLSKLANANANNLIKGTLSKNFVTESNSGELARNIANKLLTVEDFLLDLNLTPQNIKYMQKQGTLGIIQQEAKRKHDYFVSEMVKRLDNKLARYEIKAMQSANEGSKKLGKDVKATLGMAEPVPPPNPPASPSPVALPSAPGELPPVAPISLPPPIQPPVTPALPAKPSLMAEPVAPTPQTFTPTPEPTLPAASGLAEKTGDFMEKNLLGGKGLVDNPITKLAGLKYLLGSAALPAEAGYLGMNALTSPTAAGAVARLTFRQGGIEAIESWARRYPSYRDGILDSPQDRRSLTKEIEDASDIPIEQKAILQSKINRGKPLQERL